MAWTFDVCEVEINGEEPKGERQDCYYHVQDLFIKEVNDPVFCGRVRDCDGNGLEGALLKIYARRPDGRETALAHAYSGQDGYYLVNVPRPDFEVARYIVRSGMSSSPPRSCQPIRRRSAGEAGGGGERSLPGGID